jgi:hypothetical protein
MGAALAATLSHEPRHGQLKWPGGLQSSSIEESFPVPAEVEGSLLQKVRSLYDKCDQ